VHCPTREEVGPVLKKVAVAALAAGTLLALRKRTAAQGDQGLWAEATSSPDAVRTTHR
jgi:cytochrome c551/c552